MTITSRLGHDLQPSEFTRSGSSNNISLQVYRRFRAAANMIFLPCLERAMGIRPGKQVCTSSRAIQRISVGPDKFHNHRLYNSPTAMTYLELE